MTDWVHVALVINGIALVSYLIFGAICTVNDMRRRQDEE